MLHHVVALATLAPITSSSSSPLGRYGAVVASLVAVSVVLTALAIHVAAAFGYSDGTDPFIDSAALLVIGVVLGASALGGQAAQAHEAAQAANIRLDKIGAPSAQDGHGDA